MPPASAVVVAMSTAPFPECRSPAAKFLSDVRFDSRQAESVTTGL
jgi:hypothetical protein